MKTITEIRNELKALIPEGIDVAIKGIKAALAEGTDQYNDLLLIEARYQQVSKELIQGTVSDEASKLEFNKIRKDLIAFIDILQENHLTRSDAKGVDGQPDIYNGEVLYRIPHKMQLQEEVKCLVRLAFDRKVILEDIELQKGDVLKDIRISEVMGVELLDPKGGKAFEIRTLHDTVQFVEKDLFTEWVFFVTPILEGLHDLVLKISIIEIKKGIERKRNVVLEEKVEIVSTAVDKSGVEAGLQNAGIALSLAGKEQGKAIPPSPSAPLPEAPVPRNPPSTMHQKSRPSFRKMAATLSTLLVLVVAAVAVWNTLEPSGNVTPANPKEKDSPTPGNPSVIALDERKAWNIVRENPTPVTIHKFIEKYPESAYVPIARITLDSLSNVAWDSALASRDTARVRQYLHLFPNSKHAVEARRVIVEWKRAERPNLTDPTINRTPSTNNLRNHTHRSNNIASPETGINTNNITIQPDITLHNPSVVRPNTPLPMASAFRLPIYPGCRNDNNPENEKKCTKRKITWFVERNLQYPQQARQQGIEGTITIDFTVEKDGRITNIKYRNDIGGGCAREAVRLVKKLP
ncbi:MAG TPA: TonB family protein, partial [Bacteroidetes bacterium]|nr:TonB family protein [Bacteroidota bacterium]